MKKLFCVFLILCFMTAGAEQMIAASGAHALYIDKSGAVWAWGSNQKGESNPLSADARVLTPVKVFDDNAVTVACGRQFSARINSEGLLSFWGKNCDEAESIPDAVHVSACEDLCAYALKDGSGWIIRDGSREKVIESGAVSTACGAEFALFLMDGGDCVRWEDGKTDVILTGVTAISANGQTGMLVSDGEVYVFGASGPEGRLGIDTTDWIDEPVRNGVSASVPAAGVSCSGAIDDTGRMYIWGAMYSYMTVFDDMGDPMVSLMDGHLISYGKTPIELYGGVRSAAFGEAFAVLLMNDGGIMLWGSNDQGQCGDGCYTACHTELDADDEDGESLAIVLDDNQQRVFPLYYIIG